MFEVSDGQAVVLKAGYRAKQLDEGTGPNDFAKLVSQSSELLSYVYKKD